MNCASTPAPAALASHGFGLIDVSLGIIAGIGLLVGAIIVFQQVNTSREVSEVTRLSIALSSEIRGAARPLARVSDLPGNDEGELRQIGLSAFNLDTLLEQRASVLAPLVGPDQFTVEMRGMTAKTCTRAASDRSALGVNVLEAGCLADEPEGAADVLRVVFSR